MILPVASAYNRCPDGADRTTANFQQVSSHKNEALRILDTQQKSLNKASLSHILSEEQPSQIIPATPSSQHSMHFLQLETVDDGNACTSRRGSQQFPTPSPDVAGPQQRVYEGKRQKSDSREKAEQHDSYGLVCEYQQPLQPGDIERTTPKENLERRPQPRLNEPWFIQEHPDQQRNAKLQRLVRKHARVKQGLKKHISRKPHAVQHRSQKPHPIHAVAVQQELVRQQRIKRQHTQQEQEQQNDQPNRVQKPRRQPNLPPLRSQLSSPVLSQEKQPPRTKPPQYHVKTHMHQQTQTSSASMHIPRTKLASSRPHKPYSTDLIGLAMAATDISENEAERRLESSTRE